MNDDKKKIDPKEVADFFLVVEETIKDVQNLSNGALSFPAINELRYAGRHILRVASGKADTSEGWYDARKHCLRAMCDISQIGLDYVLIQIDAFKKDYANVIVVDVVPNYLNILMEAQDAQVAIAKIDDDREKQGEDLFRRFRSLRGVLNILDLARVEINKKVAERRRRDGLVILGIMITLVVGILKIFLPE